jgi:hypothetical protein
MEEDKLGEAIAKGHEAEALLSHHLLKETFKYLEETYTQAWKSALTTELREQAWYMVRSIQKVHDHLQKVATDGRIADRDIQELVRRKKRAA